MLLCQKVALWILALKLIESRIGSQGRGCKWHYRLMVSLQNIKPRNWYLSCSVLSSSRLGGGTSACSSAYSLRTSTSSICDRQASKSNLWVYVGVVWHFLLYAYLVARALQAEVLAFLPHNMDKSVSNFLRLSSNDGENELELRIQSNVILTWVHTPSTARTACPHWCRRIFGHAAPRTCRLASQSSSTVCVKRIVNVLCKEKTYASNPKNKDS